MKTKPQPQQSIKEIEEFADIQHQIWSHWQKYLHSKLEYTEYTKDGKLYACYVLDAGLYERWSKQIDTPYSELTEKEKESDRKIVKNFLGHSLTKIYELGVEEADEKNAVAEVNAYNAGFEKGFLDGVKKTGIYNQGFEEGKKGFLEDEENSKLLLKGHSRMYKLGIEEERNRIRKALLDQIKSEKEKGYEPATILMDLEAEISVGWKYKKINL